MESAQGALTLGTAGHVDHGKTALVAALTGVDTDRLPQEKARGLTIELGYARLPLPSGRSLSLIDVPGHARFVRTMVAGATGIDLFLMVVAADDGVMPQTIEHAKVLRALGINHGVIAVTKADVISPGRAAAEAAELLPGAPIVACSARTGSGLAELVDALDRVVAEVPSRAGLGGAVRLHVDRIFTVTGRGAVVTGTLWSGTIAHGDTLELLPSRSPVRVRGLEVHGDPGEEVQAGQRVAVNLVGSRSQEITRGQVLVTRGTFTESSILDCVLDAEDLGHGQRVQILHGTRAVAGRIAALREDLWQVRLESPVVAAADDRFVVRRLAPPDTLGGGVVIDPHARRHGPREDVIERLTRVRAGLDPVEIEPVADVSEPAPELGPDPRLLIDDPQVRALEQGLLEAGSALLSEAQIDQLGQREALRTLREAELAVRVSGRLYGHTQVVDDMRDQIVALIRDSGPVTLPGIRDSLGLSRKTAQAFLEHLDGERITRRLPDDSRVLVSRDPGRTAGEDADQARR